MLRAEGQALAENCATLARMTAGAAGMLVTNPVTRISREIWQYTIAGYSESQLEAYLSR